jgi:hypothetical protein
VADLEGFIPWMHFYILTACKSQWDLQVLRDPFPYVVARWTLLMYYVFGSVVLYLISPIHTFCSGMSFSHLLFFTLSHPYIPEVLLNGRVLGLVFSRSHGFHTAQQSRLILGCFLSLFILGCYLYNIYRSYSMKPRGFHFANDVPRLEI